MNRTARHPELAGRCRGQRRGAWRRDRRRATGWRVVTAAAGVRDVGTGAKMTTDTVVWIASMTKAVTAAAAMQLVEQGKLELEAPIARVLPELASPQVLEGFDGDSRSCGRRSRRSRCVIC